MLAFVVLIAILVPAEPLELDHSWSEAMHHLEDAALLTHVALFFNWLGRGLGRAIALGPAGAERRRDGGANARSRRSSAPFAMKSG